MTAKALLALVLMSHAFYLLLLVVRARLGGRQDKNFAFEGVLHLASAYTCLLWGPFVLIWRTLCAYVLDPLRLELGWGGDHDDSTTNPTKFTSGRAMRKVAPAVSAGTYTFSTWNRETDRQATVTNRIVTFGWPKLGLTVVRSGLPVDDAVQPSWVTQVEDDVDSDVDEALTP